MKLRDYHETCHGSHPVRPGGGDWTHVMVLHDGSTVYADSAAEVLEEMIPGYELLDEAARAEVRGRHARQVAAWVQRLHLEKAGLDLADANQAALADIMNADKAAALQLELPGAPGQAADWLPEVPLVLVSTSYAPHTEYPPLGGNVVWIDPASEDGYLASLQGTGVFSYWVAATSLAPAD